MNVLYICVCIIFYIAAETEHIAQSLLHYLTKVWKEVQK